MRKRTSLKGRWQRWLYHRRMDRIERYCLKRGHDDFGCYSVTGSVGEKCSHCGRILWDRRDGTTEYQAATRRCDADFR